MGTKNTNTSLYKSCFVTFVFLFVTFVVPPQAHAQERITEILVHGNFATPTTDILTLAALQVGDPADEARLRAAEAALVNSGRFEAVEIRRRYRSIANPDDILIIVLVDERVRGYGLWAPIVAHRDGYGITYGARVTFDEPLGAPATRLSVPMTWGGERRAALEITRTFETGPLTSFSVLGSVFRVRNPHYREVDSRREVTLRADRIVRPWLRVGADARYAHGMSAFSETVAAGAADITLDTRQDPSFPRNAFHATLRAGRLSQADLTRSALQVATDLRGYIGVGLGRIHSPLVLALRAHGSFASAPLPRQEQPLAGGSESLRGYRAGHDAGDSMAAISAELRLPITSPLSFARFGVKAFVDAAAAWPHGLSIRKQQFDSGIGAGVFFSATLLTGGVDIAWPEAGKPRVHASLGVAF